MLETLDIKQVHNTVLVFTHLNLLGYVFFIFVRCQIDELNNNLTTIITAINISKANINGHKWIKSQMPTENILILYFNVIHVVSMSSTCSESSTQTIRHEHHAWHFVQTMYTLFCKSLMGGKKGGEKEETMRRKRCFCLGVTVGSKKPV